MAKYSDLKSYLQINFADLLKNAIQQFIDGSYDGRGFHSINVLSLCKYEIENIEVKALKCYDDIGPLIKMDVGVSADIVELGIGSKRYEANRKNQWFSVYLQGNLNDGLSAVEVLCVGEFDSGHFEKENALDQFLVPYIYTEELENQADDFTAFYCDGATYDGYKLPVYDILQELELDYYIADLPDNCFGRMYFRSSKATVYKTCPGIGEVKFTDKEIAPGTMLISRQKYFLGHNGTQRLTIAHELVHWYLHQKYFKLLAILDNETDMLSCEAEPDYYDENMTPAQKAHWFAEWQANALAIRVAMPRELVLKAFKEAAEAAPPYGFTGQLLEDVLERVSELFDVPKFIAKQRARQLGIDTVDGVCIYIDGRYHEPFYFANSILDQHQTFVIDQQSYEHLYKDCADYAALIDSGEFVYLGYVTCINDSKYITVDMTYGHAELKLTAYAREHADECCLVFSWSSTSNLKDQFEFYGQAYLSKDVNADYYVEHTYDSSSNDKCVQKSDQIEKEVAVYNKALDEQDRVKREMSNMGCKSFADGLKYHMSRKGITVQELAERSRLSETTIKKYRSGKIIPNPPLENIMAVCIGLNLSKPYCLDLLKMADYTLGDNLRGRAFRFLLDYTDGNLEQWNQILDAFHLPHIPDQRNQI